MTHDDHDDFGGLQRDLLATGQAMNRRGPFRLAARLGAGVSALQLAGCADSTTAPTSTSSSSSSSTTTGNSGGTTNATCTSKVPEETAGPYPGDGSNGPNVLSQSGVVRADIRPSFAGLSGTADGVLLTVQMTLVSASTCAPLAGRAVYIWHCDRLGRYSLYSSGVTSQNFLRGVQEANSAGVVTFTTIYPGCYAGRWPHIHFEVYPTLAASSSQSNKIKTSQLAMPKSTSDNVFSDGSSLQLPTVSGSVAGGFTSTITVAI